MCVVKVTRVLSANAAIKAACYLVPKRLSHTWKKDLFILLLLESLTDFVSDFVGRNADV